MELRSLQGIDRRMNEGVWVRLEKDETNKETGEVVQRGARIKLRHGLSTAYQDALRNADRALRKRLGYRDDKDLTGEELLDIRREAVAHGAIVEWEGFTDNGAEVGYSPEVGLRWLAIPTFFLRIFGLIQEESNYHEENLRAISGN